MKGGVVCAGGLFILVHLPVLGENCFSALDVPEGKVSSAIDMRDRPKDSEVELDDGSPNGVDQLDIGRHDAGRSADDVCESWQGEGIV